MFGARLALAERYATLLAEEGVAWGLIGPREVDRVWDRHILNCAVLGELVPTGATVADIGSGAGLPGIPLALARPDLDVTLVEPLLRRTRFLDLVVGELRLERVRVLRGRADSPQVREAAPFDVVTARAVAPLERLARWCLPLLGPTGQVLALKGAAATEELAAAAGALAELGAGEGSVHLIGESVVRPGARVVSIPRSGSTVQSTTATVTRRAR